MALTSQTIALDLGTALAEKASKRAEIEAIVNDDFTVEAWMIPDRHHFGMDTINWVRFRFSQETRVFTKMEQRVGLSKLPEEDRIFDASLTFNHDNTYTLIMRTSFGSAQYAIDVQHRFFRRRNPAPDMAYDLFNTGIKFDNLRDTLTVCDEPVNDNSLGHVLYRKVMDHIQPAAPAFVLVKVWVEPNPYYFDGDDDGHEAGIKYSQETQSFTPLWCVRGLCDQDEADRFFWVDVTHDRGNIHILTVTTYFGSARYAIDVKRCTSRLLPLSTLSGNLFNKIITVVAYDGSEPTDDDAADSDNRTGSDDDDINSGSEDSSDDSDIDDDEM
jgi:hypothetical protein